MRMFLEKGFTNTSAKAISNELNISTGNLTFYFPTKEHILLELTKEITAFHTKCIDKVEKENDDLFSYCWEVVAQIMLCEENEQAKDIYLAIYSYPLTLQYVKEWTAEKNQRILGDRLKDWTYERFRRVENVTCCIERSALREKVIKKILDTDYHKMGHDLLKQLTKYVENQNKQALENAKTKTRK